MIPPRITKSRYRGGEVLGDEGRMQETIDYWWSHVNAEAYRMFQEYITGYVCEVGCNIGMMCLLVAQDPKVIGVDGIDVSRRAIESALKYRAFLGLDLKVLYHVMDFVAHGGMMEAERFDSVMTFHTLEHIYPEDLKCFLDNMYYILKPGGYALVSVPNGTAHNSPDHVTFFSMSKLLSVLTLSDFVLADCNLHDSGRVLTGLFFKEVEC